MTKYKKWRDLEINPKDINTKLGKITKIINYYPAGNDVIECVIENNNEKRNVVLKIERSRVSDFVQEKENINMLQKNKYYEKVPKVLDLVKHKNKNCLFLEKRTGNKLSEIFKKDNSKKEEYLYKYGKELAIIHKIPKDLFKNSYQRDINSIVKTEIKELQPYVRYLSKNYIEANKDTFIHGDFHYGNILWDKGKVSTVLDFEYSGKGFKEQDIAWATVLRPGQKFMDNVNDIKVFLSGYKEELSFNFNNYLWCLINCYCHFYNMNSNNKEYCAKILELLEQISKENKIDIL